MHEETAFSKFAGDLTDLLWAGILWLLCSLPVITIGAASAALYYTVVKVIRRKRETVTRAFFYSFRQNLKQGIGAVLLLGAWGLMLWRLASIYQEGASPLLDARVLLALLVLTILPVLLLGPYLFPVISRFRRSLPRQLLWSLILGIRHLPTTLYLIFLYGLAALFLYRYTFLLFVLPGPLALVSSLLLERVFLRYMEEEKKKYQEGDLPWYLE